MKKGTAKAMRYIVAGSALTLCVIMTGCGCGQKKTDPASEQVLKISITPEPSLIGFTCTGTFQLWLNCAQNFAKENVGWADPSIMQTYYSAGTLIALVVTALLTRKIKDVRFIVIYPVICLATLIVVLTGQNQTLMIAGAFIIGWAGAGGLLQIATSVCNMLFPKIKGTVTALVMIASSLCNYTILTAASKMQPSQVMIMNIVLTAVGVVLGLFVNIRYKKMVELAEAEN